MATTKKTHLVVSSSGESPGSQDQLEKRAARFGLSLGAAGGAAKTSASPLNPADNEKLAARAARFADVKAQPISSTNTTAKTTTAPTLGNVADAGKMAKRAARFADIPMEKTSKVTTRSGGK